MPVVTFESELRVSPFYCKVLPAQPIAFVGITSINAIGVPLGLLSGVVVVPQALMESPKRVFISMMRVLLCEVDMTVFICANFEKH